MPHLHHGRLWVGRPCGAISMYLSIKSLNGSIAITGLFERIKISRFSARILCGRARYRAPKKQDSRLGQSSFLKEFCFIVFGFSHNGPFFFFFFLFFPLSAGVRYANSKDQPSAPRAIRAYSRCARLGLLLDPHAPSRNSDVAHNKFFSKKLKNDGKFQIPPKLHLSFFEEIRISLPSF